MQRKAYDPLAQLRQDLARLIAKEYKTVEEFCWKHGFQKSTLSRLLSGKRTEFQIKTLMRVAEALGRRVIVKLET